MRGKLSVQQDGSGERQLIVELEADAAVHADACSLPLCVRGRAGRPCGSFPGLYRCYSMPAYPVTFALLLFACVCRGVPADPVAAFQDFIAAADGGDGYAW